ncbi:adenylyltransferase/cytidyltransferase family protein [candidate division WWE3 bacterium]|nr:adenylyltransferase/cytidyltransferase family protein [candidate division WWE3 bacterium]
MANKAQETQNQAHNKASKLPPKTQKTKQKNHKKRHKKLLEFKDLQKTSKKLKKQGKKIVFTIGSWDLINPGHCRYLADAKAAGHILVAGVSSDASDKRVKGKPYPLIPEDIRAELVTYIKNVDYVTIVDNDRPHASLIMLQPETFYTCEHDWENGLRNNQDKAVLEMYGGATYREAKMQPYYSVNSLVSSIAHIRFLQILQTYLNDNMPSLNFNAEPNLKPVDFGQQKPLNLFAYNANKFIHTPKELPTLSEKYKKQGKKVVLVSGSYDLLHVGHARFIEQASLQGDVLVAAIPSDEAVRSLKGSGRPVMSERSRAYVLASLDMVDHVAIFPQTDVLQTIHGLKPDVFYTVKESWNEGYKDSPEYKAMKSYGGEVIRGAKQSTNISASAIIDKVAHEKVREIFEECMDRSRYEAFLMERSRLNGDV